MTLGISIKSHYTDVSLYRMSNFLIVMLNVIMLSVVMLNVVAPFPEPREGSTKCSSEDKKFKKQLWGLTFKFIK